MGRIGMYAAVLAVLAMAGCGSVVTTARGSAPFSGADTPGMTNPIDSPAIAPRKGYVVADLRVDVPADLRVSEANSYYPFADIVWRGDPYGDRRAQVAEIFQDAFARVGTTLDGGPQVVAEIEVRRFHALTEKARYTVGGVHSVHFMLTLRDAASGAVIDGPHKVKADMRASGGARALAEEAVGYTQRIAITGHLAEVLADELSLAVPSAPDGVATQSLAAAPDGAVATQAAASAVPKRRDRETAAPRPVGIE